MIDFRLLTFLTLCEQRSYTKTAELLHITQPAVTQHIQYLQRHYGCTLMHYKGRQLTLTHQGELLRDYAMHLKANSDRIAPLLNQSQQAQPPLRFGATLTIGEYTMPPVIAALVRQYPQLHIAMQVDNTEVLLHKLWQGSIDFALLEGRFDKSQYHYRLLSEERFVAVCAPDSPLAAKPVPFQAILGEQLIVREHGSGTRDILEQILAAHSMALSHFEHVVELGNMNAIKQLVQQGLGITFLYHEAVKKELAQGTLSLINIQSMAQTREFNFVYLKQCLHQEECERWYHRLLTLRQAQLPTA